MQSGKPTMTDRDRLAYASISDLRALLSTGELTAEALASACRDRIEQLEP